MLRLKFNVDPFGLKPEALLAIVVAESVYSEYGYECVITSITDGKHSHDSDHYTGYGVDFRTYHLEGGYTGKVAKQIYKDIKEALTDEYVVLLESNHIHVSFNPTLASKENNAKPYD